LIKALQGDALATFPQEAFEADVVVHRVFGHRQFISIAHRRSAESLLKTLATTSGRHQTIRVLSPIFGRGLFVSTGEEWRRQRRTVAPVFTPRAIQILARHVAAAAESLITELTAVRARPMHLVPVLRQLALESIVSAMFSLEMKRYGAAMRQLILVYGGRLGSPTLLDFLLPLGSRPLATFAAEVSGGGWISSGRSLANACARPTNSANEICSICW
jgi:cytochrome P450